MFKLLYVNHIYLLNYSIKKILIVDKSIHKMYSVLEIWQNVAKDMLRKLHDFGFSVAVKYVASSVKRAVL